MSDTENKDIQPLSGRLELTWTNKHKRLLAHEDESYEWTSPSDYRVAEVRLLNDVASVGKVHHKKERAKDNLLIRGDALHALTSLTKIPEFAREYAGKVRLVYIDPPFNTGKMFNHYSDALEHSVWLTAMRDRLLQVRELLSDEGSVWVHLNEDEAAYCKAMMDEVFGRSCFVTSFIWRKVDSPNDNKVTVTPDHDYIICYTKTSGSQQLWERQPADEILAAYGQVDNHGHRYRDRLLKKNGKDSLRTDRPTMWYPLTAPDGTKVYPIHDGGREARWSKAPEAVAKHNTEGDLIWKQRPDGDNERWVPYIREWAPEVPTRPWATIWTDVNTTRQAKAHLRKLFPRITPFDTPKPEELISRIIEIATHKGDVVLDCFAGSGTTAAVAHKMERRWVTGEWSRENTETFVLPRLKKVVTGKDKWGVTERLTWEGGGGFRVVEVAPSMFDVRDGNIVVAPWATDDALAEAVAAQAGFEYQVDDAPFCGHKGRQRLAVVDGLVNPDVASLLVTWLAADEVLVVYGTAIDPDTKQALTSLRRGSLCRKVPQTLLNAYRRSASKESMFTPPPSTITEGEVSS
ncbi:MAG: site-specific DNA-methyltransferase [Actinobacteria bacterium HGW-Actinobacteria-7]|nr:MAG: site-specific DNA-methyltransferase [Actinobacteria bacterium HGW-Actinobacteria-7]